MISYEQTTFGFLARLRGKVRKQEVRRWLADARHRAEEIGDAFCLWSDCQELVHLDGEALEEWNRAQVLLRNLGLRRSVVVLGDPSTLCQFRVIGQSYGRGDWERCLDASSTPDWESRARGWILRAEEPELVPAGTP